LLENLCQLNPNPCSNGGICYSLNSPNSFKCLCKQGYTGNACETLVNFCSPNPCLNGGTCSSSLQGYL
jgi:hypothetical protein